MKKGGHLGPPFCASGIDPLTGSTYALLAQRSLGRLPGECPKRLREMLPIMEQKDSPGPALHQERDQRRIRLSRVAVPTGQDQIVRPVISRLSPPGTDMVEGDHVLAGLLAAVCADGAM